MAPTLSTSMLRLLAADPHAPGALGRRFAAQLQSLRHFRPLQAVGADDVQVRARCMPLLVSQPLAAAPPPLPAAAATSRLPPAARLPPATCLPPAAQRLPPSTACSCRPPPPNLYIHLPGCLQELKADQPQHEFVVSLTDFELGKVWRRWVRCLPPAPATSAPPPTPGRLTPPPSPPAPPPPHPANRRASCAWTPTCRPSCPRPAERGCRPRSRAVWCWSTGGSRCGCVGAGGGGGGDDCDDPCLLQPCAPALPHPPPAPTLPPAGQGVAGRAPRRRGALPRAAAAAVGGVARGAGAVRRVRGRAPACH